MNRYFGSKTVSATPMSRADYNDYRSWVLPANENGADEGYLVEDLGAASNDSRHAGYISWSPKAQFDAAYRAVTALTFGQAIELLKQGKKVARAGWNGKDMWISLSCNPGGDAVAGRREIAFENFWSRNNSEYARKNGGSAVVMPCLTMKNATGEIQMGWNASQADMLAEDWQVVA